MAVSARINRGALNARFRQIQKRTRAEVFAALQRGGQTIADDYARRIIDPPKTGRIYRSKWRKGAFHQASAPGQSPAGDSGRLAQSATWQGFEQRMVVEAGSATPYAVPLELGTVNMAPRPALSPAFRVRVGPIVADIAAAIRKGSRK